MGASHSHQQAAFPDTPNWPLLLSHFEFHAACLQIPQSGCARITPASSARQQISRPLSGPHIIRFKIITNDPVCCRFRSLSAIRLRGIGIIYHKVKRIQAFLPVGGRGGCWVETRDKKSRQVPDGS